MQAKIFIILAVLSLTLVSAGCEKKPGVRISSPGSPGGPDPRAIPKQTEPSPVPTSLKVSVMAYNLENLFDNVRDGNETPTPDDVLEKKLSQLSKAILQIPGGPDVMMVEEVENLNVLNMLNTKYLKSAGYKTVQLLESNDERGIDVGVISKFPLAGDVVLHRMPFSDINPTRGILEVPLKISEKKTLRVFAYHFPSQANPVEQRRQAAEVLRDLIKNAPANEYVVAGGDSNITTKEEEKEKVFHGIFHDFQVSHLLGGCTDCKGTYSYNKRWDFLDAIITRETVQVVESIKTPDKAPTQMHEDPYNAEPGHFVPQRFNKATGEGMSDHLPIYSEIVLSL